MNTTDSQSCAEGKRVLKNSHSSSVEVVPASSEVRRFTRPAKVAVRPLNMKMKTEKNATMPNGMPEKIAGTVGRVIAWWKSASGLPDHPRVEGAMKKKPISSTITTKAEICSIAKKPLLSWATPLPRVFL